MKLKTVLLIIFGMLFFSLAVVASAQTPEPAQSPIPANLEIPFLNEWASSAHADASAAAFHDWDNDKPPEIPVACARCHSTPGYLDFLGADGSAPGVVDKPAPIGTVITCIACHNQAAIALTEVKMPSGATLTGLGPEARCMECHQGRASTVQVD